MFADGGEWRLVREEIAAVAACGKHAFSEPPGLGWNVRLAMLGSKLRGVSAVLGHFLAWAHRERS